MPLYEYRCEQCAEEFEVEQKVSAPKGATCPHCWKRTENRLISRTSFQTKGSGWFRSGGY